MTEPSQYFKGRTVQEQMDEVIGYVDKRAEEVAAAKANAVLQPAEQAKTAAQAAAEAAEAAKDTTLAALPEIRQDISGLKAEDVALDGRLDTVELKVTTAEGNIVTIQGQIVALQNAQGDYVKKNGAAQTVTSQIMVPTTVTGARDTQIANGIRIQNDLDAYEPMLRTTGNQIFSGIKRTNSPFEIYGYGTNNGLRLVTPIDRSNFTSSVFCDVLNWCDKDTNRIISLRVAQENDGSVKLTFLFHTPDGTQINIGYIGIDSNGTAVKSGVFA